MKVNVRVTQSSENGGSASMLFGLSLATFAIATTEFTIVGLLPEIAIDLGVNIPSAGLLVSGYAIGVAVGGPVLVIATTRMAKKNALLLFMAIFIVGHVLSAVAFSYTFLMASRIVAAGCHASFLGLAAVVATSAAPKGLGQRAVAKVWLGFSAASLIGVPSATALGQAFGWRATFWALAAAGVVSLALMAMTVPRIAGETGHSLAQECRTLRRPQVLIAMGLSLLVCAITFSVFTFIAPLLVDVTGVAQGTVPFMLLLFGIGGTIGLLVTGHYVHLGQLQLVLALLGALVMTFVGFWFWMDRPIVAGVLLLAWGFLFFAPCVPLQMRVVEKAIDAPNLASTLNQAAFNVGNALGPLVAAVPLSVGLGFRSLPVLGLALTALAMLVTFAGLKSEQSLGLIPGRGKRKTELAMRNTPRSSSPNSREDVILDEGKRPAKGAF
jgi:DHA1 family inner membrane transport protein